MIKSIQQFQTEGVKKLEKVFMEYSGDMTRFAEMVYGVRDGVLELARDMIEEELEAYDEWLRKSERRKAQWQIVRRDKSTLLTSIGSITYHKTLFKDKQNGQAEYLLDRCMGLEKHARMTEDAEAAVLMEAAESSYQKGGEHASIGKEVISKTAVMEKIHRLKFPETEAGAGRKSVSCLYIDADEDHVALQYLEKKGDIGKRERGNTVMPKIIYVYEGISGENGRNELVEARHFGGVYEGADGNEKLWREVREYIEGSYDMESLRQIYISGDGAAWIKSGTKQLEKAKFVLDKFHMHKYIKTATAHLRDSREDARQELYRAIHKKKKYMAEGTFEKILAVTQESSKREAVEAARTYILGNWSGIMEQVKNKELECSAEGHVSHIYADRMSSRPLGWSRTGADRMARLRIYRANGGDMLKLVRYQKKEKAAGAEEIIYSSTQMLLMEKRNREKLGELADLPVYSIPYTQIKKIASLKNHIWGL